MVVANGSSELIRILGSLISRVTVPVPTFNEYLAMPKGKVQVFPLPEEQQFRLDPQRLLEAARGTQSDLAVVCNPNNPVGNLVSREDIVFLLKSGLGLIVDEAFIDWSGPDCSCQDLVPDFENLTVIKSLTKTTGVPGLRLGYMLTSNLALLNEIRQALPIWNINAVAERFLELLPGYGSAFEESLEKGREDRQYLMQRLQEIPFLNPLESAANFILCQSRLPAQKLGRYLFEQHRILIRDSLTQAVPSRFQYIRLAVRPRADVDRLMAALEQAGAQGL